MVQILIKNNLKLIFRNIMTYIIGILWPIFLIAATSISLEQSLPKIIEVEHAKLGYQLEALDEEFIQLIERLKKQEIELICMDREEAIIEIAQKKVDGFLEKNGEGYRLLLPELLSDESIYIKSHVTFECANVEMNEILKNESIFIRHETLEAKPSKSSKEYYGLVELAGCVWVSAYLAGMLATAEKRSRYLLRMGKMGLSPFQRWASRFVPSFLGMCCTSLAVMLWLVVGLGINLSLFNIKLIGYIFFIILSFTLLNTLMSFMFKQNGVYIMSVCVVWIAMGFLGGNFQNTWQNFIPERVQRLSILYYINRSVMELCTYGESKYLKTSLVVLGVISLGSFLINLVWIWLGRYRKDENLDID